VCNCLPLVLNLLEAMHAGVIVRDGELKTGSTLRIIGLKFLERVKSSA